MELNTNFQSDNPISVILTGNAGDGKTNLCRQVCRALGQDTLDWSDEGFLDVALPTGKTLRVVKDFTARGDAAKRDILQQLAKAVFGQNENTIFLIAANEGIVARRASMTAQEGKVGETDHLKQLAEGLEDALNRRTQELPNGRLRIFDLSLYSAAEMLNRVLDAILSHSAWEQCSGCAANTESSCPIALNRARLQEEQIRRRLQRLVAALDWNAKHLTVRHLFTLAVNALLGHCAAPRTNPMVTSCGFFQSRKRLRDAPIVEGSYFQNIFGENLKRPDETMPFAALRRLQVGEETNNRIDRLLLQGDLENPSGENPLKDAFDRALPVGDLFADREGYLKQLRQYREGNDVDNFLTTLRAHRRRLYFELAEQDTRDFGHRTLTVYQSLQDYERQILPIASGSSASDGMLGELVRGLNRIFVGGLVDEQEGLFLATSGVSSQDRIATLLVRQVRHDVVDLSYDGVSVERGMAATVNRPAADLVVRHKGRELGRLELSLARFEFLMRVAEGVLPASFSPQQYEDFLAFKSTLVAGLQGEPPVDGLHSLDIVSSGQIKIRRIKPT